MIVSDRGVSPKDDQLSSVASVSPDTSASTGEAVSSDVSEKL